MSWLDDEGGPSALGASSVRETIDGQYGIHLPAPQFETRYAPESGIPSREQLAVEFLTAPAITKALATVYGPPDGFQVAGPELQPGPDGRFPLRYRYAVLTNPQPRRDYQLDERADEERRALRGPLFAQHNAECRAAFPNGCSTLCLEKWEPRFKAADEMAASNLRHAKARPMRLEYLAHDPGEPNWGAPEWRDTESRLKFTGGWEPAFALDAILSESGAAEAIRRLQDEARWASGRLVMALLIRDPEPHIEARLKQADIPLLPLADQFRQWQRERLGLDRPAESRR